MGEKVNKEFSPALTYVIMKKINSRGEEVMNTQKKIEKGTVDLFNVQYSNCLKGVAVVILLFHHCFLKKDRYQGFTLKLLFPEYYLNYLASFGKICVSLFVFVSAYGLTKKMMSLTKRQDLSYVQGARDVIGTRLVKLLGNFMFVFICIVLACRVLRPGFLQNCYGTKFPDNAEYFLVDMFGLADYLDTPSIKATFWYYGLAIFIILVIPLLFLLLKKLDAFMFMVLMTIVNFFFEFHDANIRHYFLCIGVGMVCAYTNFITRGLEYKFSNSEIRNKIIKFVLEFISVFVLMVLRQGPLKGRLYPLWDAVIPVVVTLFCCEFIFSVTLFNRLFHFLGIYSAGIFLIHNFIRTTWFNDFTYSFGYPVVIVLVLLADSLVASMLVEGLKKLLRYNVLLDKIIARWRIS